MHHCLDLADNEKSALDSIISRVTQASASQLHKIKFGRGVVGKMAVVAVAAIFAIGAGVFHLDAKGAFVAVILIAILAFLTVVLMLVATLRQPELAVLEGMELVQYKHVIAGSKDYTPTQDLPPIPDPKGELSDGDDRP